MISALFILLAVVVVVALAAVPLRRHRQAFRRFSRSCLLDDPVLPERQRAETLEDAEEIEYSGTRRLSEEDREGFVEVWHSVQRRFETQPRLAVTYADLLICDVLQAYGYPVRESAGGADVFLDGALKEKYRSAHQIALRGKRSEARPEALKKAINCYGQLFEELLSERVPAGPRQRDRSESMHHHTA